ncbi:MAG: gamma-glutamyltransferase [Sphingobium sp.]|nr:gamma-glutamyltransferase [Sphingobium sp.]
MVAGTGMAQIPTIQHAEGRGSGGDIVNYREIHGPVIGRDGMVASQSAPATKVGVEILRAGGNAVDAAIAVAFAEAVTLPRAGNIGGGGYMVIHMAAKDGKPAQTITINYYGIAPNALTSSYLLDSNGKFDRDATMTYKGVSVPGTVAGMWDAHKMFGSMPWKKLVEPAIRLAKNGVRLTDGEAEATASRRDVMMKDPGAFKAFFKADGSAYKAGDIFKQPDLAWSLTQVAMRGRDGFYKGVLAKKMVEGIRAGGGLVDEADLANYKTEILAPIWSSYRGVNIAFMPPTSSGVTLAEIMNLIEHFPVKEYGWGSSQTLHLISESMKIASSDRRFVGGLPDWNTPAKGLASKAFARERVQLISPTKSLSSATLPDGNPYPYESIDTTHYSVADQYGNAVSNTYTLTSSYGAHVVPQGTGVLLNNSLGNFSWSDQSERFKANLPAPGKRLGSTITPLIAFRDNKPWLVTGSPGGGYIISAMTQVLMNTIDFEMNIAEAAERPRIHQSDADSPLEMEEGFSPDLVPILQAKGHKVRLSDTMGSTQSIMISQDRFLGAADTRRPDALAEGVN